MLDKKQELVNLIDELNEASRAYYQEAREIISNFEYDAKYDRLVELEKETGIILANSPSRNVGYEIVSELPKEKHPSPMLSLDKTKSVDDLSAFLKNQEALLSWKLDGLTVVLSYSNGQLLKAVTRGNGEVGEIITNNAKVFDNIPISIPFKGNLVLRGEAVIGYSDFEKINAQINDIDARYKNPRNLCSGSVRQLNSQVTASRHVKFYAFSLVRAINIDENGNESIYDFNNSRKAQFDFLKNQGFDVVEHVIVNNLTIYDEVETFRKKIVTNDIPSDGLVLTLEDLEYSKSLGRTAKFPRDSIAFKWQDETAITHLLDIEWSPSRTGLINPVAIFEPVELEGTTVSRASVHNVSIVKELKLDLGDKISVYKANMIIPQIAENITAKNSFSKDIVEIPNKCPACGGKAVIKKEGDVETLYCTNKKCPVKELKSYALLVSRDALNIEGLSEATLEKFLSQGFLKEYADLFRLDKYKDIIISMDGFGEKSYENLISSINKSRNTNIIRILYGLGITGIGLANAKLISKYFNYDISRIRQASVEEFLNIDQMGDVLANEAYNFFQNEDNSLLIDNLLIEVNLEKMNTSNGTRFEGKIFVITGSLNHYTNRKELQNFIESEGGKCASSVSAKTSYLINNDITSSSSKNKKAKELNVPIITEEDFLEMIK